MEDTAFQKIIADMEKNVTLAVVLQDALTSEQIAAFMRALTNNTSVKRVCLADKCEIGESGYKEFATLFTKNNTLKILALEDRNIDNKVITMLISSALLHGRALQYLSVLPDSDKAEWTELHDDEQENNLEEHFRSSDHELQIILDALTLSIGGNGTELVPIAEKNSLLYITFYGGAKGSVSDASFSIFLQKVRDCKVLTRPFSLNIFSDAQNKELLEVYYNKAAAAAATKVGPLQPQSVKETTSTLMLPTFSSSSALNNTADAIKTSAKTPFWREFTCCYGPSPVSSPRVKAKA